MKPVFVTYILIVFVCIGCASKPKHLYNVSRISDKPDYQNIDMWAAHPDKEDWADKTPNEDFADNQESSEVDVFFLHPTTYTGKKSHKEWNGDVYNQKLNKRTDKSSIKYQASLFNGAGRVFAPRYRQAHLHVFYTRDSVSAKKALNLAYSDIKEAFEYYLAHHNQGRPFIIAAHSQGTLHAAQLIKDYIEGKDLKDQLVVAYLVGMPVAKNYFDDIKICESPEELSCFCSWRSYRRGRLPSGVPLGDGIAVTNPISWKTNTERVDKSQNQGTVLKKFNKVRKGIAEAQIHQGLLWLERPKFPFSFLLTAPNYHAGDYNLYYVDVRNNAILRANAYLRKVKPK